MVKRTDKGIDLLGQTQFLITSWGKKRSWSRSSTVSYHHGATKGHSLGKAQLLTVMEQEKVMVKVNHSFLSSWSTKSHSLGKAQLLTIMEWEKVREDVFIEKFCDSVWYFFFHSLLLLVLGSPASYCDREVIYILVHKYIVICFGFFQTRVHRFTVYSRSSDQPYLQVGIVVHTAQELPPIRKKT